MKKLIACLLTFTLLLCGFSVIGVFADGDDATEAPTPKIEKANIFDCWNEEIAEGALTDTNQTEISFTEEGVKFTFQYAEGKAVDPYVGFNPKNYTKNANVDELQPKEVYYVVFKIKSEGGNGTFQLFYAGVDGSRTLEEPYDADGEWQYLLFDFSDDFDWEDLQKKRIKPMRFDWATTIEEANYANAYMIINSIGFFKTEEEAYAFMGKEVPTTPEKTTKKEPKTDAPEVTTNAPEVTTAEENKSPSGCGGVVSGALVTIALVTLGGTMIAKKKD